MRLFLLLTVCFRLLAAEGTSVTDQRIAAAQRQLAANAKSFQAYNDLAFALYRQARDRDDSSTYALAEAAIAHSLQLSPDNFDALKLRATVLLGKREFAEAAKLANILNKKIPDDINIWALLVDSNAALGKYTEAERDAQWVLDLRPGSALGFEKAAELRVLFGDSEGALQFFDEALRRTGQNDSDQRAWLETVKAEAALRLGNVKLAEAQLAEAQTLFPESLRCREVLARVRMAQERYAEAATLFEQCYRAAPGPRRQYEWAEALDRAQLHSRAEAEFQRFETSAQSSKDALDLVAYYSDRQMNPAKALSLASNEAAWRQDSATVAALAWALYRNGRFAEAKTQMDKALSVGIQDAVYFCKAAQISAKLNDAATSSRLAKESAALSGKACDVQ